MKKILIRYGICIGIATAIVFCVLSIYGFFDLKQLSAKYRCLGDSFFISGILFVMFGALFFVSDEGAFDGIGWAMKSALRVIFPFVGAKDAETYRSYRERKHSKPKTKGYTCMLITGVLYITISVLFIILEYNL